MALRGASGKALYDNQATPDWTTSHDFRKRCIALAEPLGSRETKTLHGSANAWGDPTLRGDRPTFIAYRLLRDPQGAAFGNSQQYAHVLIASLSVGVLPQGGFCHE